MNVFTRVARAILEPASSWRKVAVLALAAWSAALIVPEFARVFVAYGTLGFEANNDGRITQVKGPPATTAGLEPGDCIDLANTPFADLSAVFGSMGGTTYVRPRLAVTLRIAKHGCTDVAARATPYRLEAAPAPQTETYRAMLAADQIAGLLFILLAALLVWQHPSTMTWGFFVYAAWFNPGQWFVSYAELQRNAGLLAIEQVLQAAAEALGYAGFVSFALRFPHDRVEPRWRPVERALPWLALLLFALQIASYGAEFGVRSETVGRAFYYAGYAIDIAVLFILRIRRRAQSPEDRQRTRWVHWGCRVGLIAFIFADSNMATSAWDPFWRWVCPASGPSLFCADGDVSETFLLACYLVNFTVALAVFHAVREHRVIDVRFALSRAATLFLTSFVLAGVLALASTAIEHHLQAYLAVRGAEDRPGTVETTLLGLPPYILAVALLKLTFDAMHEWMNKGCDRLFFRGLHAAERSFRDLHRSLGEARTAAAIDDVVTSGVAHALALGSAALARRKPDGTYVRAPVGEGWDEFPREIEIGARVLDKLARRLCPVADAGVVTSAAPLGTAHPIIAAPVVRAVGDPLAIVAIYGAHTTGDRLNDEEMALVHALCAAAGPAYDRVELLALRERVDMRMPA